MTQEITQAGISTATGVSDDVPAIEIRDLCKSFGIALFQIFPGFFGSLNISDLRTFLRRRAPLIVLSLVLIISLSFNIYLVIPKTHADMTPSKATHSSHGTSTITPTSSGASTVTPTATPPSVSSSTGSLSEFPIPTSGSLPVASARGSDGNFWFTEEQGNKIGRVTPEGAITEFLIPTPQSIPGGLTRGSDGNLWFYENKGDKIGRITPQGQITEFPW